MFFSFLFQRSLFRRIKLMKHIGQYPSQDRTRLKIRVFREHHKDNKNPNLLNLNWSGFDFYLINVSN
jgi:hypothetical protein